MDITLTISATPEVLQAINALAQSLSGSKIPTPKKPSANGVVKSELAAENNSAVTIEQVRAAVQKKAQTGNDNKEKLKAILEEFEVKNVTSLSKDQYAAFLTKVEAL